MHAYQVDRWNVEISNKCSLAGGRESAGRYLDKNQWAVCVIGHCTLLDTSVHPSSCTLHLTSMYQQPPLLYYRGVAFSHSSPDGGLDHARLSLDLMSI